MSVMRFGAATIVGSSAVEAVGQAFDATVVTKESTDLVYLGKPIAAAGWPPSFERVVRVTEFPDAGMWRAEVIEISPVGDERLCASTEHKSRARAVKRVVRWGFGASDF